MSQTTKIEIQNKKLEEWIKGADTVYKITHMKFIEKVVITSYVKDLDDVGLARLYSRIGNLSSKAPKDSWTIIKIKKTL
jgi:hypothetical protein